MPRAPPTHKPVKHVAPMHRVAEGSKPGKWEGDLYRGSRHERGYGKEWDRRRQRVLARDGGLCQPCLREGHITMAKQVDHVIAKAHGGPDEDENCQAICIACHKAKTAREWQQTKQEGREGLKV